MCRIFKETKNVYKINQQFRIVTGIKRFVTALNFGEKYSENTANAERM